jgi:hypothetical protein
MCLSFDGRLDWYPVACAMYLCHGLCSKVGTVNVIDHIQQQEDVIIAVRRIADARFVHKILHVSAVEFHLSLAKL